MLQGQTANDAQRYFVKQHRPKDERVGNLQKNHKKFRPDCSADYYLIRGDEDECMVGFSANCSMEPVKSDSVTLEEIANLL